MKACKTPCDNCPFRKDVAAYITPERGREIRAALQQGGTFPCHKTVDYSEDDDADEEDWGQGRTTADSLWCAGALMTMERTQPGIGGAMANQMVRISARLGMLDLDAVQGKELVFTTWDDWFKHLGEEQTGLEYCDVAGSDCENPPGFGGMGGGVMHNEDPPECDPDNTCWDCGAVMCSACSRRADGDRLLCEYCAENYEEDEEE